MLCACSCGKVCLPDWPWWNRHPLEWLEPLEEDPEPEKKKKKKPKEGEKAATKEKVK